MLPQWILLGNKENELNEDNLRAIMRSVWQLRVASLLQIWFVAN